MIYDESHPQLHLVFLIVREALDRDASRIVLARGERTFSVSFDVGGNLQIRDDINNRHWHQTLAAVHALAGETAFHYPSCPDVLGVPDNADDRSDRILIDSRFPDLDNTQLRHLRAERSAPIHLSIHHDVDSLVLQFDP